MLLGIHNALFLSWRWVWTLGWGKWSTGGCRIPALTYLRMHSCRSTPSCTETPTHDSSTPLSSDHWCRGGHAPRLSHRPPTPSSFFLSLSPPNFSPFPSISLHCSTTRGESTPLSCTPVVMVGLNFFFLLIPFSPVIFEGIPHFFSVSPEHAQTETGRHRVENAVFESYFSPLTIIPSVCGSSSINYWFSQPSFFFFTQTCFATFISWRL